METSDDTGGINLDSLNTEALEFHAIDELVIGKPLQRSDVLELYSPVRVDAVAAEFALVRGMSLDLTNVYNVDEKKDQDKAWELIRINKPTLVIGSPPCTYVYLLQGLRIAVHGSHPEWMARLEATKLKAVRHF